MIEIFRNGITRNINQQVTVRRSTGTDRPGNRGIEVAVVASRRRNESESESDGVGRIEEQTRRQSTRGAWNGGHHRRSARRYFARARKKMSRRTISCDTRRPATGVPCAGPVTFAPPRTMRERHLKFPHNKPVADQGTSRPIARSERGGRQLRRAAVREL